MEENYIYKKGRKRLFTGKLNNFTSLSNEVQETFKDIKKEVNERVGRDVNVYVFGSYFWGYADDGSDYDVRVDNIELDKKINLNKISNRLSLHLEKQVHIVYVDEDRVFEEGILIP